MGVKKVYESFFSRPTRIFDNIAYRINCKPSDIKHIFVIGAPRSGTTLLQGILTAHSHISGFDEETGFFMLRDIFKFNFEGIESHKYQEIANNSKSIVEIFDKISELHLNSRPFADFFLEKTPQHVLCLDRLVQWFPEAYFINVYRDVRDSCLSAMKFTGIEQGSSLENFVSYWNKCVNARQAINSPKIYDVKYEDLVRSPQDCVTDIMEFLNIPFQSEQLDVKKHSLSSRSGKDGFSKLGKPIDSSSVGRWREQLNDEQLSIIEKLAGENMKKLKYL